VTRPASVSVARRPRIRRLNEAELGAYTLVPRWIAARAVLIRVPVLPPGATGMTSGRLVFLRRDEPTDGTSTLIAHELVHVRQFTELGRLSFGARYLAAYVWNLLRMRSHRQAYLRIPQEVEAYSMAAAWANAARAGAAGQS
jgi:tRNA isopentenyl-2-thiomethyl-A-37 hydroxylase MiaE